MEDIRNHDAQPTSGESEWMAMTGLTLAIRAATLAVIALSVGLGTSAVLDQASFAPKVVAESSR